MTSSQRRGTADIIKGLFPGFQEPSLALSTSSSHRGRRRKSRSPDRSGSHRRPNNDPSAGARVKKPVNSVATVSDEISIDRGRRVKTRSALPTHSRSGTENSAGKERERMEHKEHPKSNEPPPLPANATPVFGTDSDNHVEYSGPLAVAEFIRLKKDNEFLKKKITDYKKVVKTQNKTIEELKLSAAEHSKAVKDKDHQISKLKSKSKKSEEVITNIESNLTCQICMELLVRPYALSPCGHILCLHCLQEWFRKAPPADDEMNDDDSDFILYRRKTCPCCRADIKHRPVPVFIVKSITATLAKAKGGNVKRASPVPDSDTDVWEGLFPDPDDEEDYDDDRDDEGDEDEDEDPYDDEDEDTFLYGSDSEEEAYTGAYVPAQWEPPSTPSWMPEEPDHDISTMLRRGCTIDMVETYGMFYKHEEGLVAFFDDVTDEYIIYLGWNVCLSLDDHNGERFMTWIMNDIFARPERWIVNVSTANPRGTEARRLVREDDVEEYDTTDSERWIDRDESDGLD